MIASSDYQFLAELLRKESGLSLGAGKEYLLETRLEPVAAVYGEPGVAGVVQALRRGGDRKLVTAVCEAMTTRETLFFRDNTPFQLMREKILPALAQARRTGSRRIRIWSAASSSGQEAYSVAMIAAELGPTLAGIEIEIVGTDFAAEAVARARAGVYSQFEVQRGLPIQMMIKYFTQTADGWQINEALRKKVTFREGNLLSSFAHLGTFDVVFCRNVLIYFDQATKKDVLDRIADRMAPDAWLFLGGAETTLNITDRLMRTGGMAGNGYQRAETVNAIPARRADDWSRQTVAAKAS